MADEGQVLSQVMPFLLAGLICDVGVVDPNSGKKSLIGIYDRIIAQSFPTQRVVSVYIRVTDAEGNYVFQLEFVHIASGRILATAESPIINMLD